MAEDEAITHTESESKKKLAPLNNQTIEFRVEKFEPMMESYEPGKNLWSEGVSSEQAPRAVWKLELYPNSDSEYFKGNVAVFLWLTCLRDDEETLEASCHIYLVDASGRKIDVGERTTNKFGEKGYNLNADEIDHERVKKALHADGSLLVVADIDFLPPDDEVTPAQKRGLISGTWYDSIGKLRETEAHSDCTLMVGGEQLKAHRNILAAISPYFEAMFGNEAYQEAKDGVVHIEDFAAKPCRALLSYSYTGRVDWILFGDCKREVLKLACKYLIDDLKHNVEELLINEINPESFVELVLLADAYSCDKLKEACIRYLSSNVPAVVLTPQWKVLMKTKTDLSFELLQLVCESKAVATQGGTK